MIFILLGLIVVGAWVVWFILQWSIWFPLIVTLVLGILALVLFVVRFLRGRRSAAALERAIAEQGRQQVMNARPERRAEIQALQKQINDGIQALKSSKLGGKKRGSAALYSLPWYAIIGPPGAGKTTAIKHSGLVFPYADTSIRGVGGTRNCDWWFTNEAILLDTAGRYATEQEDQQEWIAFLDMVRKYRSNKPLNGLIVAVSIPDIIDANEQQIEIMGKKLRARVDEVMTRLRMVLPVYLLVTKSDLIAGFSEFFGNLRKSERAQAWGATFKLTESSQNPAALFQREFDLLVQEIHKRSIKRLAQERNRAAHERIFQFPLEFAGVRRNIADLISTLFMVNTFQGTPLFRGFYFTSGTQEGRPLDRVLARMGQAMGIAMPQQAAHQTVESKSYFLHDVFMNIVFPDADVAARSASEVRRQRLVRIGVSAAALSVAALMAVPSSCSFKHNRDLLAETESLAQQANKIKWDDPQQRISEKLKLLTPLLAQLEKLDGYEKSLPVDHGWLMYFGDKVHKPLMRVFVANMQEGFVKPCKHALELKLSNAKGTKYLDERHALKTYLMLSDIEHLDVDWATAEYVALWTEILSSTSNIAEAMLRERIGPLIAYYLSLLKNKRVTPPKANDRIVAHARGVLQAVPVPTRYYAQFVDVLIDMRYDPAGDMSRANRMYPPIRLEVIFATRPDVLEVITSKQFENTKKWYEVPGPYTDKGHYAVLNHVADGAQILEMESWVVPLTEDERGDKVAIHIAKLADEYEQRYINAWKGFLEDIKVKPPTTVKEAIAMYELLKKPERPYLRLLRVLEDHTQWTKPGSELLKNQGATDAINQKINTRVTAKTKFRFDLDVKKIAGKTSTVPPKFKQTVAFGVTATGVSSLDTYIQNIIDDARKEMEKKQAEDPNVKPEALLFYLQRAVKQTEALMQPYDSLAQTSLLPILQAPLNLAGKVRLTNPYTMGLSNR